MRLRSLGHRAPLLWIALPFALGIASARACPTGLSVGVGLVVALAASIVAAARDWRTPIWAGLITVALGAAGAVAYELRRDQLIAYTGLPAREATLQTDRFGGLGRIVGAPPHLRDLVGQRLQVSVHAYPPFSTAPARGATIVATGVLEPLPRRAGDADTFDAYLVDLGLNFRFARASLETVVDPPGLIDRCLAATLAWCRTCLGTGLDHRPDLQAALRAMLLGERHELSDTQETLFLRSGTMHLFAISGLHIGALALALHTLGLLARQPRPLILAGSTTVLAIYVGVVGAPPSAVRAFLMVTCVQAAFVWRRPGNALAGLVASAVLVLMLDPMQLFGAGFQMSYGIVAALLLLGLPLGDTWQQRWPAWPHLPPATWHAGHRVSAAVWHGGLRALGLAVAATLVSSISASAFFGWFTPGALLLNLAFIPLATLVVFAGLAALGCGALGATPLLVLFVRAAALIIASMQAVLVRYAGVPGMAWAVQPRWPSWSGWALVGLMGLLLHGYATKWEAKRGGFWPPVIWTVAMLVTGLKFV